jgi:hypothetical protein
VIIKAAKVDELLSDKIEKKDGVARRGMGKSRK